eukprot:GHUV01031391.1.p2 GENE.GHUV01031391.1~~GHUV01031391.1.p2  ORF type:complete len:104 (-),score=21.78 GHUV01031391.1:1032-1343(-)
MKAGDNHFTHNLQLPLLVAVLDVQHSGQANLLLDDTFAAECRPNCSPVLCYAMLCTAQSALTSPSVVTTAGPRSAAALLLHCYIHAQSALLQRPISGYTKLQL